ncbi:hypothetical protein DFQ14_12028 [Halopolyspora algeriensis]|uniref:Uncharacterized protein n=1 Tax=Halopolyspora algeriensis TaxID=1500506 RepID=A0A368VIE9_9ACTN|nr:hypothetical protein [Halopolyspora algeriensis]RCW38781.1 hypothetical protein DFQ14_12028 [Halopolyspora algeriensis]TQM55723.1 hypothetical protein FHU43_0499 [Halopolyspora algeriensis]
MRGLKNIVRHFARMPRGCAADGRMLGLALSTAIDSSRELDSPGDRAVVARANPSQREKEKGSAGARG